MTARMVVTAWILLLGAAPAYAQDAGLDASMPDAACHEVDSLGECQGDIQRACVQGTLTETNCRITFGVGFTCRLTDGLGAAQCVHEPPDASVPDVTDAGVADAGVVGLPPDEDESSGCVKLTPGSAGFLSVVGLVMTGRRRRAKPSDNT